jgi:hypothetical protein
MGTAGSLDNVGGGPDAAFHRHLQRSALHVLGKETADESVAGPVRVDNLVGSQLMDRKLLHLMVGPGHTDDRLRALGDDHGPGSGAVLLGQRRNVRGNGANVLGIEIVDLGEGSGLRFVAKDNVGIRENGHHLVLEELDEEGGGQVHAVGFVLLRTVLARLNNNYMYAY